MDDDFHWSGPLPAPDFIMVPKLVHRDIMRHLSGAEFKVFYCLACAAYEWGKGSAELSVKQIMTETGVSRAGVQVALRELEHAGLVATEQRKDARGGTEASLYHVRVTDDPRFVHREGGMISRPLPPETRQGGTASMPLTRARSTKGKNRSQEDTSTAEKYFTGPHALCRLCRSFPHMPDCTLAAAE